MKVMPFILRYNITALLSLLMINGCSVKEERDACPCRLFLDLTSVDMSVSSPLTLYVASADGFEYVEVLDAEEGEECVVEVPRTYIDIVGWSGCDGYMNGREMRIPVGMECPPVYIHTAGIVADGEAVYNTVHLRRNHCVLSVAFAEPEDIGFLTVRGEVAGFDKVGKPMNGEFCVRAQGNPSVTTPVEFCIPRQNTGHLYLDVADALGFVRTFPLHKYIAAVGYDWTSDDLDDLSLTLNYTESSISIVIQGWTEEFVIGVVI